MFRSSLCATTTVLSASTWSLRNALIKTGRRNARSRLRRVCGGSLRRLRRALPAALSIAEPGVLPDFRILLLHRRKRLARCLAACGARRSRYLPANLWHFGGDLLPEWRAIELQ